MTTTGAICVADAISRLCHVIMTAPSRRNVTYSYLEYFLGMVADGETKKELMRYGKICNLVSLAGLACTPLLNESSQDEAVANIKVEEWDRFIAHLIDTRRTLLRNDATTLQLPVLKSQFDDEGYTLPKWKEDDSPNPELVKTSLFTHQLEQAVELCLVQQFLTVIKPYIYENKTLSEETLSSLMQFMRVKIPVESVVLRTHLLSLFEHTTPIPQLKPVQEIKNIMQRRKDLSLQTCIKQCSRLINTWYSEVFHQHVPRGMKQSVSTSTPVTASRKRNSTYQSPVGNVNVTPRSKRRTTDSGRKVSLDGHVSSRKNDTVTPTRAKSKKSRPTIQSPDLAGIVVQLPRSLDGESIDIVSPMRRKWTEEETNCVMLGVEKFGRGQWRKIKDAFPKTLRHRSNVQIKDRWRTLELLKVKAEEAPEDEV